MILVNSPGPFHGRFSLVHVPVILEIGKAESTGYASSSRECRSVPLRAREDKGDALDVAPTSPPSSSLSAMLIDTRLLNTALIYQGKDR